MSAPKDEVPRRARRPNGFGTIVLRKDGRYQAAVWMPVAGGGYKRIFVYGRTEEDIAAKYAALLAQANKGIPFPDRAWTVGEYLDYWLVHVVAHKAKPATAKTYRFVVDRYITPGLGRKRLGRLSVRDVRVFLDECRTRPCEGKRDAGRLLSVRTVQMIHAVLRNALQNAMREELVSRNVAKLVQVEAPQYEIGKGLSVAEARRVLRQVASDRFSAIYVVALYLGLRKGEILGLRWADVDLAKGTLTVTQTLQRLDGKLVLDRPKTRHSRRTVPVPAPVLDALREHKAGQAASRLALGECWTDSGLVFTTRFGTPIEPRNLNRHWINTRAKLGLDEVRFHDLRHSTVTLLMELGIHPAVVRAIVGHSAIDVTMTIYTHVSLDEQRTALDRLSKALA